MPSSSNSSKNKRIAKNTILLYLRSIIVLLVSLYTSRIVLSALGVDDFGIYSVVGGVVAMFSGISASLSGAISRFITFELGRENPERINRVFSISVIIQTVLAVVLLALIVIVGGWFLHNKMNVPLDRLDAATWVLICSGLTFAVTLISVAYNAMIIANERMKAFAYVSILEVFLKLGVAYLLTISAYDKLKVYSVLLMAIAITIQLVYIVYCRKNFKESKLRLLWDTNLFREMFGFAGWSFFSYSVGAVNTQGINILTNIFFGVAINAARGLAMQVETALNTFISNFTVSLNPQVIKSYAINDKNYMFSLIYSGSKFAYYLALLFIIPLFIEAETVLGIWLGEVPEYATVFVKLTLLTMLPQVLGGILFTAAMASGDIKKYSLVINSISILVFAFAWFLFNLGYPPESAYIVLFIFRVILVLVRLFLLKKLISLEPIDYINSVILRVIPVSVLSFTIPMLITSINIPPSFLRVVFTTIFSVLTTSVLVFFIGLSKKEQVFAFNKLKNIRRKILKV